MFLVFVVFVLGGYIWCWEFWVYLLYDIDIYDGEVWFVVLLVVVWLVLYYIINDKKFLIGGGYVKNVIFVLILGVSVYYFVDVVLIFV